MDPDRVTELYYNLPDNGIILRFTINLNQILSLISSIISKSDQFYDVGTSEAKLKFLLDIIKLVKKKDKEVRDCVKLFHFRSSVNFRMKESLLEQDLMSNSEHEY